MTDRELLFWVVVLQLCTATLLVVALDIVLQREAQIYVYRPRFRTGSDENLNDTSETTRAAGVGEVSDPEPAEPAKRQGRHRPVSEE